MSETQNSSPQEEKGTKEQKIDRERQELLARVASSELSNTRHRVAWLLNQFPSTRNSDIALQVKYWKVFEKDIVDGSSYVELDDLYRLTRLTLLARARAKIQNDYRLFLADPEVQEHRGTLEESEREKAIETPDYPVYKVFLDESGKTSRDLLVGSLWILSAGIETFHLISEVNELKRMRGFSGEFHFSEMKKHEVGIYKELINIFLVKAGPISFKFISVPKHGLKVQTALADLYYLLLKQGIDHEDSTGRAPLPRTLEVWKDLEEVGADKLLMANLLDKMQHSASSVYENRLALKDFHAVDSRGNVFLQIADLMAASANRIISRTGEAGTHKDEVAEYLLNRLGISLTADLEVRTGDMALHIKL